MLKFLPKSKGSKESIPAKRTPVDAGIVLWLYVVLEKYSE